MKHINQSFPADLEKMWPIVQEAIEIGGISTLLMKLLICIKDKLVLLESSVVSAPDYIACLCKALIHGLKKKQLQSDSSLTELILQTILQEIQVCRIPLCLWSSFVQITDY